MTVWEIASIPFWALAVYFAGDAILELLTGNKKKYVFPALMACGFWAYIGARLVS